MDVINALVYLGDRASSEHVFTHNSTPYAAMKRAFSTYDILSHSDHIVRTSELSAHRGPCFFDQAATPSQCPWQLTFMLTAASSAARRAGKELQIGQAAPFGIVMNDCLGICCARLIPFYSPAGVTPQVRWQRKSPLPSSKWTTFPVENMSPLDGFPSGEWRILIPRDLVDHWKNQGIDFPFSSLTVLRLSDYIATPLALFDWASATGLLSRAASMGCDVTDLGGNSFPVALPIYRGKRVAVNRAFDICSAVAREIGQHPDEFLLVPLNANDPLKIALDLETMDKLVKGATRDGRLQLTIFAAETQRLRAAAFWYWEERHRLDCIEHIGAIHAPLQSEEKMHSLSGIGVSSAECVSPEMKELVTRVILPRNDTNCGTHAILSMPQDDSRRYLGFDSIFLTTGLVQKSTRMEVDISMRATETEPMAIGITGRTDEGMWVQIVVTFSSSTDCADTVRLDCADCRNQLFAAYSEQPHGDLWPGKVMICWHGDGLPLQTTQNGTTTVVPALRVNFDAGLSRFCFSQGIERRCTLQLPESMEFPVGVTPFVLLRGTGTAASLRPAVHVETPLPCALRSGCSLIRMSSSIGRAVPFAVAAAEGRGR